MKKLLIFTLLLLPMTTFAASSVRVLGAKPATTTASGTTATNTGSSNLMRAAQATKTSAANTAGATTSRIGTVSSKAKKTTGTLTGATTTSAGSRFPVITPAHSYNTVNKPQSGSNNAGTGSNTTIVKEAEEDPRLDMIHVNSQETYWRNKNNALVNQRLDDGYVFMWIEE